MNERPRGRGNGARELANGRAPEGHEARGTRHEARGARHEARRTGTGLGARVHFTAANRLIAATWRTQGRLTARRPRRIAQWRALAKVGSEFTALYRMDCPPTPELAPTFGQSTRRGAVNPALAENADGERAIRWSATAANRAITAFRHPPVRLTPQRALNPRVPPRAGALYGRKAPNCRAPPHADARDGRKLPRSPAPPHTWRTARS